MSSFSDIHTQMTLAVAECIVQRREVSWITLSTGAPVFQPMRNAFWGYVY